MPQSVNVTFLLPPSWGQRTRFQNPTLLIQRPGHVFVQDHIRRPTTLVLDSRCALPACVPVASAEPVGHHALWPLTGVVIDLARLAVTPAPVDVECPGAVFSHVRCHSALERFSSGHNWLHCRLQCRTPTRPLSSFGRSRGGDWVGLANGLPAAMYG